MSNSGRRSFLKGAGAAAALATATLAGEARAAGGDRELTKQVIPGSPYPTFSRAVRCGRMIYVSGVLGQRPGSRELVPGGPEAQFRQALENLKASVEAAGSSMDRVVKCTCFLTEAGDFAALNKVYVKFFTSEPPARSTVIAKALVVPQAKLEIECIAFV